MKEVLVGSVTHMLPYYLLVILAGEVLLAAKEKKGLALEVVVAAIICIALTILGQFHGNSSWLEENRPVLLAVVNFMSILLPIAVLVIANQLLVKIRKFIIKHVALVAVVLVTMFIWPLWALYITCATGLDCL